MKKILLFIVTFVIIIIGVFSYQNLIRNEKEIPFPKEKTMSEKILENKKIVMIVAFRDFRDEEYFLPKEILEKAGVEVKTASNQKGIALGVNGGEAEVNLLLSEIKVADFDAIIFIGGPGCLENLDNEDSYRVAKEAISQNKIIAAICIAPVILAKAGVLANKKATVWSSPLDKSGVRILKENGVIYQEGQVITDGKIITANGPAAAERFAKAILEKL